MVFGRQFEREKFLFILVITFLLENPLTTDATNQITKTKCIFVHQEMFYSKSRADPRDKIKLNSTNLIDAQNCLKNHTEVNL